MQKIILKITQKSFGVLDDEQFECFILTENLSPDFKKEFARRATKKIN